MYCAICSHLTSDFGQAQVLGKYQAAYRRCETCGFTFPVAPQWLDEAYSSAITRSDIGLIRRNFATAQSTKALILAMYDCQAKFVDYGGGYGMFTRILRDNGFDYYRTDRYCTNLFAQGFEAEGTGEGTYELLTAFEVFEHLVNPLDEIQQMLRYSSNLFFSTWLVPTPVPALGKWWYYGLEHGQHVALYTRQSLAHIARQLDLNFYTNGSSLHLFTKKRLTDMAFKLIVHRRIAPVINSLWQMRLSSKSLTEQDFFNLTGIVIS